MGKILVPLRSDEELDRPDLNKCPDCLCFFGGDNCPLCGKPCPEEMKAGNRKPVKRKRPTRGDSGRVTFIEWYHSWWFIILMLFLFPLVGFILLATSPHKKSVKITVVVIAVVYTVVSTFGVGNLFGQLFDRWNPPVNTSLSREEYIAACETVDAEAFFRNPDRYTEQYVSVTLVVSERILDSSYSYGDEYTFYYICHEPNGTRFNVMIRDCIQDGSQNFITGDVITVYGEGAGNCTVYNADYEPVSAPCIFVAYVATE